MMRQRGEDDIELGGLRVNKVFKQRLGLVGKEASQHGDIETFYNSTRLHQTLSYQSPNPFESEFAQRLAG